MGVLQVLPVPLIFSRFIFHLNTIDFPAQYFRRINYLRKSYDRPTF
jgi:hypothetical protein